MPKLELSVALKSAELVHDRDALEAAIKRMGNEITRDLQGETPLFITVMNGGLIFAGQLALAIKNDLEFDYLHATRYRGLTSGSELTWLSEPKLSLTERIVLIADDILDEGHTLQQVCDYCRKKGARKILVAVLCEKDHGRCVPGLRADYVGVHVPDRYVFGFGMDYYEQGRNLPGIYAI